MFNKENVQKLADACRELSEHQCSNYLRYNDQMCIEGLACEVFRRETGRGEWHRDPHHWDTDEYAFVVDYERDMFAMPDSVRQWYGFDIDLGGVVMVGEAPAQRDGQEIWTLIGLNDTAHWTFSHFATWLESKVQQGGPIYT